MLKSSRTSMEKAFWQEKLGYNVELKGPGAVLERVDGGSAKRNNNDRKQSVLGLGR